MATIQGIYVALFGRPADPEGLDFYARATNNGADLTQVGELTASAEFTARFAGQTDAEIITTIFQSLFDRDPDQAGLTFYLGELAAGRATLQDIAIRILDGASGNDLAILDAKLDAADLFTARLDLESEVDAYTGNSAAQVGRDFIDSITLQNPATNENTDAAILRLFPDEGQEPGNPGGGGAPIGGGGGNNPPPTSDAATLEDGVITLPDAFTYSFDFDGEGNLTISRPGANSLVIASADLDALTEINIVNANGKVEIDGADVELLQEILISGAGTFDVTNVEFGNAGAGLTAPNLFGLSFDSVDEDGILPSNLTVNGNVKDAAIAFWIGFDGKYYEDFPGNYSDAEISTAFVRLGNDYVDYLNAGGAPIDTIVQTKVNGMPNAEAREQSFHDNVLGNLNNASIQDRFGKNEEDDPRSEAAQAFGDRPVADGVKTSLVDENNALAWDFVNGIRDSYDYTDEVLVVRNAELTGATFGDVELVGRYSSVQAAIDASADGDTLLVGAGPFNGPVHINKELTILGVNEGVAGTSEDRDAESTIFGVVDITANNVTIDGVFFDIPANGRSGLTGNGAGNFDAVSVRANNVVIQNSILEMGLVNQTQYGFGIAATGVNVDILDNKIVRETVVNSGGNDKMGIRFTVEGGEISGNTLVNVNIGLSNSTDVSVTDNDITASAANVESIWATNVSGPDSHVIENNTFADGKGVKIVGTSEDDDLTGYATDANDIFEGGAGADTINANGGFDLVIGGGGNDIINIGEAEMVTVRFASSANNNGQDTINGFTTGAAGDVLDVRSFLGANPSALTTVLKSPGQSILQDGSVNIIDWAGAIENLDFGSDQFGNMFGANAPIKAGTFIIDQVPDVEALLVVQGTDVTHIYFVDSSAAGSSRTIQAEDVTLVGVLEGVTNGNAFALSNFIG